MPSRPILNVCPLPSSSNPNVLRTLSFQRTRFYHWERPPIFTDWEVCTQVLASFAQVGSLSVYSFPASWILGGYFTNEGTEVQNGLCPGSVCVCVDLSSSFPRRSGPSLEVWVRPVPPSFLSGSQGRCGRNSCRAERLRASFRARPGWEKIFFSSMTLGVPALGGTQDSCQTTVNLRL